MPTLNFKGKSFVENHHLTVKYHQLIPVPEASLTDTVSLTDNLIIHGDNLIALKALLPNYANRVKCIYIDPPYNTGNENWRYNDNVNSPMIQEWLKSNQAIDKEDLTRHDKWLCMMMPRLTLLRELLTDDGAIFISVDDNEIDNLRELMNIVFGEQNFVTCIIWQKVYSSRMDAKQFSGDHDYILVYQRSEKFKVKQLPFEQNAKQFNETDAETGRKYRRRSLRKEGKGSRRIDRPKLFYEINAPDGSPVLPIRPDGSEGRWRMSLGTYEDLKEKQLIEWVNTSTGWQVYVKQIYDEHATKPPSTIWSHEDVGHNHEGVEELKEIFGTIVFDNPKPTSLIKQILKVATESDSIVLDSFAGSGTTGQAVLELNKEDKTKRKFILVETEDYAQSLTAERLRKVISGVPRAKHKELKEGFGGSFSFFELGASIDIDSILSGTSMPSYNDLARYLFYTATGEEFNPEQVNETQFYIGESRNYCVYLFYKPDLTYLKSTALTLELIRSLPDDGSKKRLVFAPTRYVDSQHLEDHNVDFAQLPFELYRVQV